jgi:hypothetical protein
VTTKKKAQPATSGKGREALKAKALEYVEAVRSYDADVRRAVYVALANMKFAETNPQPATKYTDAGFCERELRAVIEKVEKGVPVFDADRFSPETVAAAFTVRELVDPGENDIGVPDFISNAVRVALEEAERRFDSPIWLDVDGTGDLATGGYSVAGIARLFQRVDVSDVEVEPKRDLAGLISGVLKHPDTPGELYHAMRREIARMTEADEVNEDPAVIGVALAVEKAERDAAGDE